MKKTETPNPSKPPVTGTRPTPPTPPPQSEPVPHPLPPRSKNPSDTRTRTSGSSTHSKASIIRLPGAGRRSDNNARFNIPDEEGRPSTSPSPGKPSFPRASFSAATEGGDEDLPAKRTSSATSASSGDARRSRRRSRYSEIYMGPTNFGSLLLKRNFHLTAKVDNSYFTGKAGSLRIIALFLSVASFGFGLPGYSATASLYVGYGASPLTALSMTLFTICILINIVMVLLLLCFREVRCQSKWDDWNLMAFAMAAAIAAIAGIIELGGIFHARRMNCYADPRTSCIYLYRDKLHKPNTPELDMPYKNFHYISVCGKLLCAMCYSFCSRLFLKNNDRIHTHAKLKTPRIALHI